MISLAMIFQVIFALLGALVFLYFFWKKLKEDYTQNQIFNTGFYVLGGILVFIINSLKFFPKWVFWAGLLGSLLGLIIGINRFKLKVLEVVDAWVIGCLGFLLMVYTYNWTKTFRLTDFAAVFILTMFIFLYLYLDDNYKKFTWYRSGRVGFAGLATMGIFFLIRSVVAIFRPGMIFFLGIEDAIVSGIFSFISFLVIFNISRKEIK